jgi:AcrR family transcriptional regulator
MQASVEKGRRKVRLSPADRRAGIEDAACACIALGGIRAFTVDKVVARAGVSRGLIAHHFGSMDGLLVAVYQRMYAEWLSALATPRPDQSRPDQSRPGQSRPGQSRPGLSRLDTLIEALVSPRLFSRDNLNIWLTLWGEIATNPVLRQEHLRLYSGYRTLIETALTEAAAANGRQIDAPAVASAFICLVDGFGVQRCVEPSLMTEDDARAACRTLLAPHLGQAAASGTVASAG